MDVPPVRVLAIMGSGETAPPMARVHRELLGRLGPDRVAVLLDTPYAFQENAEEISARTLEYFAVNVGVPLEVASWRTGGDERVERATALARLRAARYVFAGPGSPSYALRHWQGTDLPGLLTDKLARGGIVTFASAAALTLGSHTVPVYEIYKVGADPYWLPGLDLLGPLGLRVALVPHYDNAEGGTHDTRFCYLGETRLARLEAELPPDVFVLGVDSHTALVLDLEAGTATVAGKGSVTVRAMGRSEALSAGTVVAVSELPAAAERLRQGDRLGRRGPRRADPAPWAVRAEKLTPLTEEVRRLSDQFDAAAGAAPGDGQLRAILELEDLLVAWSRDTDGTDEMDRARDVLHQLIVRLADRSAGLPPPIIELLVELRAAARAGRDWALGDRIRDALLDQGVELRDAPTGTTWHTTTS